MIAEDIFRSQLAVIDSLERQLQEENRVLHDGKPLPEALLARKQALVPELDRQLDDLRALSNSPLYATDELRALKDKVQRRMMNVMLLDRENERLLRRLSASSRPAPVRSRHSSAGEVQKAYQKLLAR